MTKILTLNEMMEVISNFDGIAADRYRVMLDGIGNMMAAEITRQFPQIVVHPMGTTTEASQLAGTACAFYLRTADAETPIVFEEFDYGEPFDPIEECAVCGPKQPELPLATRPDPFLVYWLTISTEHGIETEHFASERLREEAYRKQLLTHFEHDERADLEGKTNGEIYDRIESECRWNGENYASGEAIVYNLQGA